MPVFVNGVDQGSGGLTSPLTANLDIAALLLVGNGGSTGIAISAAGEVNMAAQPCVLAYNSSDDANVTGNGTVATVDFDTEVFDQNADFATDTFTAPVTGRYLVSVGVFIGGVTNAADIIDVILVASNRTAKIDYTDSGSETHPHRTVMCASSIEIDMDAADTFTVTVRVTGEASDVVDVLGSNTDTRVAVQLLA